MHKRKALAVSTCNAVRTFRIYETEPVRKSPLNLANWLGGRDPEM